MSEKKRTREDILVIQRCIREIERLEPAAQRRAAAYINAAIQGEPSFVPTDKAYDDQVLKTKP